MNELIAQHLQNHDVRPTAVRILIWKTIQHLDYAFPMAVIEGLLPTVDRSTIFRALTLFVEHDLLHPLDDGSGEKKYCICLEHEDCDHEGHDKQCSHICLDASLGYDQREQHCDHHHHERCQHVHLTCSVCGKTYCLKNERIPEVHVPEGFQVERVQYIIHGICPKCAHYHKVRDSKGF